ncbi:hypothetical protein WJX77_011683 [Trebouxia sp. C0004]
MPFSATKLLQNRTHLWASVSLSAPRRCFQHASKVLSSTKNLPPPDVHKLAQLAHLHVTEQQVKDWEPKLQSILEWFGQLQQADVGSIEPAVRANVTPDNVLRDDIPVECDSREALMAEVPEMEHAYVRVPKIM